MGIVQEASRKLNQYLPDSSMNGHKCLNQTITRKECNFTAVCVRQFASVYGQMCHYLDVIGLMNNLLVYNYFSVCLIQHLSNTGCLLLLQYGVKIFVITSFKDTCYIEILPHVQKSNRGMFLLITTFP